MTKWGRIKRETEDQTSGKKDWEGRERFMTRGKKETKEQ